ncbi:putative RDD family membrane protein YckC [Cellulomonas sp. SLBN-39]|nr:putative RDD family membrane protein YckC [Cellulomonas sp. SLBN-39]
MEDGRASYATWGQRVLATVLDGAVLSGVTWLALGPDAAPPTWWPGLPPSTAVDLPLAWTSSPWVWLLLAVYVLLQGLTGQTPGRRLVGIAVVDRVTGTPAGLLRTLVRPVVHLLDAILLVGYARPLWDGRRRTFADQVLGTLVVPAVPAGRGPLGGRAVTAVATVVCVLGLGASFTSSQAGGSAQTLRVACAPVDGAPVTPVGGLTWSGEITRDVTWGYERRLFWTRHERTDAGPLTVRWWPLAEAGTPQVTAAATLRAPGIADERQAEQVGDGAGEVAVELPVPADVEDGTVVVTSEVVEAGQVVAACSQVVDLDGSRDVPEDATRVP